MQTPFPTTRHAFSSSPAPRLNEKREALPIPISSESKADRGKRIRNICGGISQIADALSDEDLVDDIVKGADQRSDDTGYCKGSKKRRDAFMSQWILRCLYLFHDAGLLSGW